LSSIPLLKRRRFLAYVWEVSEMRRKKYNAWKKYLYGIKRIKNIFDPFFLTYGKHNKAIRLVKPALEVSEGWVMTLSLAPWNIKPRMLHEEGIEIGPPLNTPSPTTAPLPFASPGANGTGSRPMSERYLR
jgi:hypothetical protein